jgi:hypothetical protein
MLAFGHGYLAELAGVAQHGHVRAAHLQQLSDLCRGEQRVFGRQRVSSSAVSRDFVHIGLIHFQARQAPHDGHAQPPALGGARTQRFLQRTVVPSQLDMALPSA